MLDAKTLYEIEKRTLSPYACFTENSKGREYPIGPDGLRGEFQRDRDRILHSKAFRRLMHKTQVFLSPEHDHYRTRLTHTLEVTQIARSISRALRLNEDLTEAIALGHDLGHTPFGHAGERVLRKCFDEKFAHYEQSLRVVEKLEPLNLTWEVRDGIVHHTNGGASTLEGEVVLIADHIAFINHDIDDACRGGIIDVGDIPWDCLAGLGMTHGERIDCMVRSVINESDGKPYVRMDERVGELTAKLREFMFDAVYLNPVAKGEEVKAEQMLSQLYYYFIDNPDVLPKEYYATVDNEGKERAVCDYIAGMTDRYAVNLYTRLFIPDSWKG
ncbi:MAG: deoxyguanosinetriphosphate triphosphohydrolase [Clostridia bacterium]|nr:deoxyguanosinetriphosphate triphosphohydrolase [Clostridia bacterium]